MIAKDAFQGCENLAVLELCEGLQQIEIGESAFLNCKSLKRFKAPSTLKKIGRWAFHHCKLLAEVELSEGLEEIGVGAFWGCKSLKRLKVPSTVKKIGFDAFWRCDGAFAGCEQSCWRWIFAKD